MADEQPRELIRDPKRLRALSHPLRWKLIDLIDSEGTATATRCAEVLGESVASCSYHLNMLAKYDFVEEAEGGQGREKPWRLTSREQSWSSEGLDMEGRLAAEGASEAFLSHEFEAMRARIKRRDLEPDEWRRPTGSTSATVYLTIEETQAIRDKFIELIDEHIDRHDKPELRPEGARQVHIFTAMYLNPKRP